VKEKEDKTALYIVLIVVAFIVVLVVLVAAIYYFTRLPTVPEGFPEEEYPHLYKKE
jgi:flagellar basal body-associated protein FliL